jgi:hypothetical protein
LAGSLSTHVPLRLLVEQSGEAQARTASLIARRR